MNKRAIIGCFILLACLMGRLAHTQHSALSTEPLPEPQPVIYGDINGMKAAALGDMAVFFAGKRSVRMDESCADDLNCILQKHRIGAVAVNKEGMLLIPQRSTEPEKLTGDNGNFIFPSRTLNTQDIAPTRTQAVFLSPRQSELSPAPSSVTFYTGHPVVDQTSGLAFINSETMNLLATTITTMNLLSASGRLRESIAQTEPTSARTDSVFPTVTVEAEEISGLLVPTGSAVIEKEDELELRQEQSAVRLEGSSEILEIRPAPTSTGTVTSHRQWTFTVKEVSNTPSEVQSTSNPTLTPASTEAPPSEHDNETPMTASQTAFFSHHEVIATQLTTDTTEETEIPSRKRSSAPLSAEDISEAKKTDIDLITTLPEEITGKILSYLGLSDISVCRLTHRVWKEHIDRWNMQARLIYSPYHPGIFAHKSLQDSLKAVDYYHSLVRSALTGFGNEGKTAVAKLDALTGHAHFSEYLFFYTTRALALTATKAFTCEKISTIENSSFMNNVESSSFMNNVDFSIDGNHLLIALFDDITLICKPVNGQWQIKATLQHSEAVKSARFNPDGNSIVTVSGDHAVTIWEDAGGQWQEKIPPLSSAWASSARFSPDGNFLVVASCNNFIRIRRLVNGQWQETAALRHPRRVDDASFSPDNSHVVALCGKTVIIWRAVDGKWEKAAALEYSKKVNTARFSPGGDFLVTASDDTTVGIRELVNGKWQEAATFEHSDKVNSARFSPRGNMLVTASDDKTVKIGELVNGKWQETTALGHSGKVDDAHFSPGETHLLTATDNIVKIWGHVGGQWQEKTSFTNSNKVRNIRFCPDGIHFAVVSEGIATRICRLKNEDNGDAP